MTPPAPHTLTVALIGNPNTGKSTLFNALCGVRQRVGNYPGVTVEKKLGRTQVAGQELVFVDLPGTYSLAPRSPDEMIAVDVLLGRRDDVAAPDVVLCIVDASNLERNLYLLSQLLELELPTVVAVNMVDMAADKGIKLDLERLRSQIKVPAVSTQANKRVGLEQLKKTLLATASAPAPASPAPLPEVFQREVTALQQQLDSQTPDGLESPDSQESVPRYLAERLLLDTSGYLQQAGLSLPNGHLSDALSAARGRLAQAGCPVPAVESIARYRWVADVLEGVVIRPGKRRATFSDRLDGVLTHRFWGSLIFLVVMVALFQSVFYIAEPASAFLDWINGLLASFVESHLSEGALRSLLINGVIAGVGSVLIFLPQIFALFLFIAVLEDCGYMTRAAYLMDRLMCRVGLNGKSFIPLLSSFACAIPGIMAARVIENRRDRLATILIAPLMSCSARLPVYTLLIAAFIPPSRYAGGLIGLQGLTMFAMYSVGILTAIVVALILKKTILRGPAPPFVMELPAYKIPALATVLHRMVDRGWGLRTARGNVDFRGHDCGLGSCVLPQKPSSYRIELACRTGYASRANH